MKELAAVITIGFFVASFATQAAENWNGERILVESTGAGDPVVVVPGLTSSPDLFRPALELMKGSDRTHHWVALRGFSGSQSPASFNPFTQPAADELARYIEDQDLHRVALIGHSMGGVISLLVASQQPDRIDRILIADSVPFFAGLTQPGVTPAAAALRGEAMLTQFNAMSDVQFTEIMRRGLPIQATNREAQSIVWSDIEKSDRHAISVATSEIFSIDYRDVLPKVKAKVVVLVPHNKYTPLDPESLLQRYQALYVGLKDLDFKLINDSRHFIMLDQPQVFAQQVKEFLDGVEDE